MKSTEELAADTSALIYVAKADAFDHLHTIGITLVVAPGVWQEAVVEGRRFGYADVARIEAAGQRGWLRRVPLPAGSFELSKIVAIEDRLGMGESQVIVLAGTAHVRAIIDDRRAARAARARGVVAFSTLALGMLARRAGMSLARSLDLTRALAVAAGTRADVLQAYERRIREEDR
jgi:predicted nucleic acid-binding protein